MNDTLGTRLKQTRLAQGITQTQLAEVIGVHYTQVGRYEKKGVVPAADILARIANELGVSSDYLLNGTREDLADATLSDKVLLNQFKQIEALPVTERDCVKVFLDAFITKKRVQQLAG